MNDTESFEYALWKAIDDCKIDENTDTITGSYIKSLSNQDRVVAAHIREMRDMSQCEYDRGFHDGQHSMDAEHRAVVMRLRHLPLDGGSVENVFNIARAVYHNDFGWAANNCAALRDELVRLMGGVSDENVHVGGLRCVDGCRVDVSNGKDTWRTYDAHSNRDRNHMAVREGVDAVIGDSDDTTELTTTDEFITFIKEDTRRLASESNQLFNKNGDSCETGGADDTCNSQCCGACAAVDGDCFGKQTEVGDDGADCDALGPDARGHAVGRDFHELGVSDGGRDHSQGDCVCNARLRGVRGVAVCDRKYQLEEPDERAADDSGADTGCWSSGCDLHMAGVTYDVLWNERHEVVRALRDVPDASILSTYHACMERLLDAVGVSGKIYCERIDNFRDRLIHLLGGDQPSGIDVLREMEANGTCPDGVPIASITDELREWARTEVVLVLRAKINCFADRIDEQFDRICQQQEAVLQSTIDEVVEERDHWKQAVDIKAKMLLEISGENVSLEAECEKLEKQRDELVDLLRDARDEYVRLRTENQIMLEDMRRRQAKLD